MKVLYNSILLIFFICFLMGCRANVVKHDQKLVSFLENIERQWDVVKVPSSTKWVDYNESFDTRSEIDFVKGKVALETVIPTQTKNIKDQGESKLKDQAGKVFSAGIELGSLVLQDQVKDSKGSIVNFKNFDKYIIKEILPKIKLADTPFIPKDGIKRVKLTTEFQLVSDHVKVRAVQYSGIIKKYARRFNLRPEFIMAVIHAESYFNPMAKSPDGAIGLMQLMPEYGAREAYNFLYNKDIIPSDTYIYNPVNNIELGTAYFHLLKTKYFSSIKSRIKKRYLSVCSYNLGPGRIKQLVEKYKINRMSSISLYSFLRKNTPEETRNYLENVIKLSKEYKKLIREINKKEITTTALSPAYRPSAG